MDPNSWTRKQSDEPELSCHSESVQSVNAVARDLKAITSDTAERATYCWPEPWPETTMAAGTLKSHRCLPGQQRIALGGYQHTLLGCPSYGR